MLEAPLLPRRAGAQDLFNRVLQPVGVLQHHAIKLLALRVADVARLQRFKIQPYRGDRRLQLVCDRVEKAVLLFGDAHLADQEHRVNDEAGDDQCKRGHAEDQRRHAAAVDDDPADVERDSRGDEDDAEDDEDDGGGLSACHE